MFKLNGYWMGVLILSNPLLRLLDCRYLIHRYEHPQRLHDIKIYLFHKSCTSRIAKRQNKTCCNKLIVLLFVTIESLSKIS